MSARKSDYQRFKGQGWLERGAGKLVPTTPDILGPFYKEGAPELPGGKLTESPTLFLTGLVRDADGNPVQDAVLDFWQADEKGDYDNDGFKLRGKVSAALDDRGAFYRLQTIKPGFYKISEPGQPDEFRCAHIHVIVTAPGFKKLVTQLYFADDPYDATDHWFSRDRVMTQVAKITRNPAEFRFDFVLERE